jgi:four helix bundle protein
MSYKNLEVWRLARDLVLDVHEMTMNDLPKFEMFETGSQIRKSIKSVKANIAEGYGRKIYKQEYIRFLVIAFGSLCESTDHLETLYITKSLKDEIRLKDLAEKMDKLGRKLNLLIRAVMVGEIRK